MEWCRQSDQDGSGSCSGKDSSVPLRLNSVCWMEVDTSHLNMIEELTTEMEGRIEFVEGRKDFGGLDRFVKLAIPQ